MAKTVAPRFSRSFRRLCQVAALAGSDRLQRVIDGLLPVIVAWDESRMYCAPVDWVTAARDEFGLPLDEHDVGDAFDRAVTSGILTYESTTKSYVLRRDIRDLTLKRINEGEKLELNAQASWLAEVGSLVPDIPSDDLWGRLITYAGEMFLHHGFDAVALLSDEVDPNDGEEDVSHTPAEASGRVRGLHR